MSLVDEIKGDIKDLIINQTYLSGQRVPSQRQLAKDYGVSLITMHQALYSLSKEGWLTRGIGRGTFVCDEFPEEPRIVKTRFAALIYFRVPIYNNTHPVSYFQEMMFEKNFDTLYYNLDKETQSPEKEEAFLERCRQINVESIFIAPTPLKNNSAIYNKMRKNGVKILLACHNSSDMSKESFCMGDYRKAGLLAVKHLIDSGCRQLCLINDITPPNYYHLDFVKGCRDSFTEFSHRIEKTMEIKMENSLAQWSGTPEETSSLFGDMLKPGTGFILCKLSTLPYFKNFMKQIGARIPEDYMHITLNNASIKMDSTYIDTNPLTQIRRAVEILTDDNIPSDRMVQELIEPDLVCGNSTKTLNKTSLMAV